MEHLSEKAKVMAESKFNYIDSDPWSGITKREYFAGLAMQGYCGGEYTGQSGMPVQSIAKWSVEMADALLEAISKP